MRTVKFCLVFSSLLSLFAFYSCKESSIVGLPVQPEQDLLNVDVIDTVSVFTQLVKMDSARTDKSQMSLVTTSVYLGTIVDPIFGTSSTSLYSQIGLISASPKFENNPVVDSVVLSLVYASSYYGSSLMSTQKINVYELTQAILADTKYYSSDKLTRSTTDLASDFAFTPNLKKGYKIFGDSLKPQLRVPLNNSFGQAILDKQNQTELSNNTEFTKFVKGLYITTENTTSLSAGQGNLLGFNPDDSQSGITIYYHNDTKNNQVLKLTTANMLRYSAYKHDYTAAVAGLQNQLTSTASAQIDATYIQSLSGLRLKVQFPYLANPNNSLHAVGINKAELVVKVDTSFANYGSTFNAPARLIVFGIDDNGNDYILPDAAEGNNYFGGTYNASSAEYRINISRHIQQLLNGKKNNNGLHLSVLFDNANIGRAVLGGGASSSNYQMKLVITSTQLP